MPLVLALSLLHALQACSQHTPPPVSEAVRPAYVAEVRAGIADTPRFIGEVRAAHRAELAFAVAGRVVAVAVQVGDAVQAGQVLARLDPLPLRAQLAAAQGELARADAQAAEARQHAERVRRAQAAGATSGAEASGVQAQLAAAEAALRIATGQRDAAAWSLDNATLHAPVAGIVATRLVEPGHAAGPGTPVIAIDGQGRELSVLLPEVLAVKPGQVAALRGRGGGTSASGNGNGNGNEGTPSRVLRVSGRLEAGGLRRVALTVPEHAAVGSTWSVSLAGEGAAATLRVPLRAVITDEMTGSGHVLRLARDGRHVEQVAVTLGALHGEAIEVTSGLAPGDRVIVAGAAAIRPGSVVRPVAYPAELPS